MKKGLVVLAVALAFGLSTATMSFAAKKVKCTVEKVEGDKVTMVCKKADKFKVGDKLKIAPAKKKAAVEGC